MRRLARRRGAEKGSRFVISSRRRDVGVRVIVSVDLGVIGDGDGDGDPRR